MPLPRGSSKLRPVVREEKYRNDCDAGPAQARCGDCRTRALRRHRSHPVSEAEQRRWVIPLTLAFTWSALFFSLAIGTGTLYFLAPAGLGIGLIILFFVYLGLTSDTNSDA